MIIDFEDNNILLYQSLLYKAQQLYNPVPKCGVGSIMFMFMTEEEKIAAAERTKKYDDTVRIIHELLFPNKRSTKS